MLQPGSSTRNLGIAALALVGGFLVYSLARYHPPALLIPQGVAIDELVAMPGLFGWAPSFLYTLAIALVIAACVPDPTRARWHCVAWTGLCLLLELSQHPAIADPLGAWMASVSPTALDQHLLPYWHSGVFDPLDLIATLAGGLIALALITRQTRRG